MEKEFEESHYSKEFIKQNAKTTTKERTMLIRDAIFGLFNDFEFFYYAIYMTVAFLAWAFEQPSFLAYNLIDIFYRSPLLRNLLQSIY